MEYVRDAGSESQESRGADKSGTTGSFAAELAAREKPISPQKPVCGTFLPLRDRDDHGMMSTGGKKIFGERATAQRSFSRSIRRVLRCSINA